MFFSRMRLNLESAVSGTFRDLVTGPYQVHEMIWQLFADIPDRKRDFLYRADLEGRDSVVYLLSERKPEYDGKVWDIESKPYNPVLREGDYLSFLIRVNPVVTRTEPDVERKCIRHRHDVIMDAKRRLVETNSFFPGNMSVLIQQESSRWLLNRSEGSGFLPVPGRIIAGGYRKMEFSQGRKKNRISISVVDLEGVLRVTEPDLFLKKIYDGIGPAKGFGCGLMLIKRAFI